MSEALSAAGGVWQGPRGEDLMVRTWENESVVWVEATGGTHLLSPAASVILGALIERGRPGVPEDIACALGVTDHPSASEELQAIRAALLEFEAIGLVKQIVD